MRDKLGVPDKLLTEEQVDSALTLLGESEGLELASIREQIQGLLRSSGGDNIPRLFFLPCDEIYLWEVNGKFAAAHSSVKHNSVYLSLNFLKFVVEKIKSPEELDKALYALVLFALLRLRGKSDEYATARAQKVSPELCRLYYNAIFLQPAYREYLAQRAKPNATSRGWKWHQITKIPEYIIAYQKQIGTLNFAALSNDRSEESKELAYSILERKSTACAIQQKALKIYKDWQNLLRAAGLDPEGISQLPPAWTDEQIARIPEAIKAYNREIGVPNARTVRTDTTEKATQVVSEALDRENTTPVALYGAVQRKYGSNFWDKALKESDLDPEEIRKAPPDWTNEQKKNIPKAIKAYAEKVGNPNADAFQSGKSPEAIEVISQALGRKNTSPYALYQKAVQIYNNWDETLKAAEFDPKEVASLIYWSAEQAQNIPKAVRAYAEKIANPNYDRISMDRSPESTKVVSEALKRSKTTAASLCDKGIAVHGNWDTVLRISDLDPDLVRLTSGKWTDEQTARILAAIKAYAENIGNPNYAVMLVDNSKQAVRIVSKTLGRPKTNPRALLYKAVAVYGDWPAALRAAEFDPEEVQKELFWTDEQKEKIPDAIKAYADNIGPPNVMAMITDVSPLSIQIVSQALGRKNTTPIALYGRAIDRYGNYRQALLAAEQDPEEVRQSATDWTPEQEERIPEAVRTYSEIVGNPNAVAFIYDLSTSTTKMLSSIIGRRDLTTRAVHLRGVKKYGCWDNVLRQAGLSPPSIRRDGDAARPRPSYWKGKIFDSRFERDTAIVLYIMGIISEPTEGINWQVTFQDHLFTHSVDFYSARYNALFEPHGEYPQPMEEYVAEREFSYKDTWAENVKYKFFFPELRFLINDIIPMLIGRKPTSDEIQLMRDIMHEAEQETEREGKVEPAYNPTATTPFDDFLTESLLLYEINSAA